MGVESTALHQPRDCYRREIIGARLYQRTFVGDGERGAGITCDHYILHLDSTLLLLIQIGCSLFFDLMQFEEGLLQIKLLLLQLLDPFSHLRQ